MEVRSIEYLRELRWRAMHRGFFSCENLNIVLPSGTTGWIFRSWDAERSSKTPSLANRQRTKDSRGQWIQSTGPQRRRVTLWLREPKIERQTGALCGI